MPNLVLFDSEEDLKRKLQRWKSGLGNALEGKCRENESHEISCHSESS